MGAFTQIVPRTPMTPQWSPVLETGNGGRVADLLGAVLGHAAMEPGLGDREWLVVCVGWMPMAYAAMEPGLGDREWLGPGSHARQNDE